MNDSQKEAIATADAHTSNAALPTYSELVDALNKLEFACTGVSYMEAEYSEELGSARALLEKFDRVS